MNIEYTLIYWQGKISCRFRLLTWTSFIDQFVHPVSWEGMGGVVILARCKFQLTVHKNLVQYLSNNLSIVLDNVLEHPPRLEAEPMTRKNKSSISKNLSFL